MKIKRIMASMLAALMLAGSMSFSAAAQTATVSAPLVVTPSEIKDAVGSNVNYSTIYYGGIPWMLLDKEFSNGEGETGYYLLSEHVYGHGTFWNAHYGPGDYVWNRTGIYTRLDVLHHPNGYNGDPSNTSPTNLGYQASDIRKYMTGIGEYEAVFPRSMHEHGNPDNSGLNVSSYFWKTKVTASKPTKGVEYYIKGEFKLSNCEFNNYETLAVTADDWLPDTWYTYDAATDTYNLVTEAPEEGVTLTCYHDATEYYKVGELDSFEPGVDYYTFEKISDGMPEWEYTKLEMQSNSIAKGALYCAFTVTDMKKSTSEDVEGEGRVILSGENDRSFASDMGFSDFEQSFVLPTTRKGATNGGAKAPSLWTYKNSGAYSDELVADTYFLPTAADLKTYLEGNGISKKATYANGDSAQYWLSSMMRYDRVAMCDSGGGEWYQHPTMKHLGIRPAFNFNPETVAFYAPPVDSPVFANDEDYANEYKIVLAKDNTDFTATLVKATDKKITVAYENADFGNDNYITAMFKDKSGNIVSYGFAAPVKSASGTVEIDVSAANGDIFGRELLVFNEERNGDFEINYAGNIISLGFINAATEIDVMFELSKDNRGEKIYDINLKADKDIINRLNSVDLTFALTPVSGSISYEIIESNDEISINNVNNSDNRYEFHYDGKDDVATDTASIITIGQVKFTGYGTFSFAVDSDATTNVAHATTLDDNIVDTFTPDGDTAEGEGYLDIESGLNNVEILVPTEALTINVNFPNAVENNEASYQDMKVTVSGADLEEDLVIELGDNGDITPMSTFTSKTSEDKAVEASFVNGAYVVTITDLLTTNTAYTVTVSGAGYRTARYTVTMTMPKTLNFWNNVKDNDTEIELDKSSSAKKVTFLAGDIVKDSKINIYDLSAVVSYFGEIDLDKNNIVEYAKYDLNRDGKIDSKDVAYVLVSWGN